MAGDVDARDLYDEALAWVAGLMRTVPTSLLSRSTPCPEYSVRALMGYLVGTAERGLATAQHRPITSIPHVVTRVPDEAFATRYGELTAYLHAAWSEVGRSDEVRAPWGPTTADAAVWGFATETLVHGWDLAVATDQPSEARQSLVQPLLTRTTTTVPASNRKGSYAEMVTSTPDAGPTEQLANWLGHRR